MGRADTQTSISETRISVMDIDMDELNEEQRAMLREEIERIEVPEKAVTAELYAKAIGKGRNWAATLLREKLSDGWTRAKRPYDSRWWYWNEEN